MRGEDKATINITMKIENSSLLGFESWLNQHYEVVKLKILPSTEQLYNDDETFKKLVKGVKKAQRERDIYINDHNGKYKTS